VAAALGQTFGDDAVRVGVEGEADMGPGDFEVAGGVARDAIAPVDEAVGARVDSRFHDSGGEIAAETAQEGTGAASGVAGRKDVGTLIQENLLPYGVDGALDAGGKDGAAKRGAKSDYGGDLPVALGGGRPGEQTAETVSEEMDFAAGLAAREVHGVIEALTNEEIRAVGIQADSGVVRTVADAAQPGEDLDEVDVAAEETGDDHYRGTVASGNAETVVDGRGAEEEDLDPAERLLPKRQRGGRVIGDRRVPNAIPALAFGGQADPFP
jgi:hypothetical protein